MYKLNMKRRGEIETFTLAILIISLIFLALAVVGVILFKDQLFGWGAKILDTLRGR